MTNPDPFEWLKSVNPVPRAADLPDPADGPDARALFDRVVSSAAPEGKERRRRRARRVLLPVVAAATVAATAAATWIWSRPPDDPTQFACYAAADLDADVVGIAGDHDPIASCRHVWSAGEFDEPAPDRFAACVLDTGIVAVFPGDPAGTCSRLGLPAAELTDEPHAIVGVQTRLAERFTAECVPVSDAPGVVEEELRRAGLDDWRVVAPSASMRDRPCGSIAIDASANTVTIVAVPPPPAG